MTPLPEERVHVATDGGAIVAGAGAFEFGLTIPGGPVPTAGVTVVGVLPTHRRRGIVRELMSAQLKDAHARGEPIAALWASEGGFYGRFGYGMASVCADVEISKDHAAFNRTVDWAGEHAARDRRRGLRALPAGLRPCRRDDAGDDLAHGGVVEDAHAGRLGVAARRRRRARVRGARAGRGRRRHTRSTG